MSISGVTILVTILNLSIIIILLIFSIKIISSKLISGRLKKIIIIMYCAILFSSFVIYCFIPNKNFINADKTSQSLNRENIGTEDFKKLVLQKKLEDSKEFINKALYKSSYNGKVLKIIYGRFDDTQILAEQKDKEDGIIEVNEYIRRSNFSGIDLTDKISNVFKVQFKENELLISRTEEQKFNLTRFHFDITTNQFLNSSNYNDGFAAINSPYILVKIPKNVQIDPITNDVEMIKNGDEEK